MLRRAVVLFVLGTALTSLKYRAPVLALGVLQLIALAFSLAAVTGA